MFLEVTRWNGMLHFAKIENASKPRNPKLATREAVIPLTEAEATYSLKMLASAYEFSALQNRAL